KRSVRARSIVPKSVRYEPRRPRSNNATPNRLSSDAIACVTAGWERLTDAAARPMLLCRATASNTCNCRRLGRWVGFMAAWSTLREYSKDLWLRARFLLDGWRLGVESTTNGRTATDG